jgi:hypothetical protein
MRRFAHLGLAGIACMLVTGTSILAGNQRRLPSLMVAAEKPLLSFATALAAHGYAAGFLIPESVLREPRGALAGPADFAENADLALSQFLQRHTQYSVMRRPNGFIVRHADVPPELDRLLSAQLTGVDLVKMPAMMAAIEVGRRMARQPESGGGVAGTGPPPEGCPVSAPITFRADRTTALDLLETISRQARGLVWFVSFEEGATSLSLRIGLVCGNERMYVLEIPQRR